MRALSLSLAAVLLTGAAVTAATPAAAAPSLLPFNLGLAPGVDASTLTTRLGVVHRGLEWIPGLNAVRADLEYDDFAALWNKLKAAQPEILRYAEVEQTVDLNESEVRPLNGRELEIVKPSRAKPEGRPVTVAVLDTGVTANAALPASRLVTGVDATRLPFVMLPEQPDMGKNTADDAGFGTMAAGIIAGDSGFCPSCRIMPVKIANQYRGELTSLSASLAAGIVWATDNGAQIITTPAVVQSNSNLIREAVAYALSKDVLIVASAGKYANDGRPVYPAATDPVLAVSAVDTNGGFTGRSNYDRNQHARWIDVAAAEGAPAVDHLGEKKQLAGVEGATAVTAGAAALALSSKAGATAAEVRRAITFNTTVGDLPVLNAGRAVHDVVRDDSEAPVVTSTGLTDGQLVTKTVSIKPTATDDYGIGTFALFLDNKYVSSISKPWEALRFVPPAGFSGDFPVTIRVVDYSGKAAIKTTVVKVDTLGPTGAIASPAAGTHIRGAAKVVFRGAADVASAKVNGVAMKKTGADWVASAVPSKGQLLVEAADAHGNITRFTRTVVADNDGPTATVNPAAGTRKKGTFTTSVTGVKDASGVAKAELWANGKYLGAGFSKKVATGKLNGNVKLVWKLTDKLGNARTYTRTVIADNKGPSVSITKAPKNKAKVKGTVKVYVKASDSAGVARVELLVNGKVVAKDVKAGYVLSVNTKKQKKTMKVRVRAYDKLGNVTYTSTRTWYRS
ncbi:hypothetical protein ACTI_22030 [Actinoplanes sp. OR16]|uniref:S8 family serine peptidase n=1 Tax=Actinoplanes sp. OR16 TaxID=946334 RepID=UPI000F6C1892|nr:Ig-like domain-containing protein [Actinoplanes sp. OR16]BBH65518.1 hypothetical protein ACTI_22030 [Actinoplanes sp. OR16]